MTASATPAATEFIAARVHSTCANCLKYELNLCRVAAACALSADSAAQSARTVPARRIICREQDLHGEVPIICEGWAASVVMLSDGSRQILSFLLPGDIVSAALLFDARPQCLVEAITDVRYRSIDRIELKGILFKQPDRLETFLKAWIEEKARADQLIVDLGRRTAEERIARLLLNLEERLTRRDMVQPESKEMEFPLRQHHIADAVGLTPVHVSKVLSEFRRGGLIKISQRSLTVLDPAGLRRVAHMR